MQSTKKLIPFFKTTAGKKALAATAVSMIALYQITALQVLAYKLVSVAVIVTGYAILGVILGCIALTIVCNLWDPSRNTHRPY